MARGPPSQDPPLGLIWSVNTTRKRSRRGFDGVADAICLNIWFLKDAFSKITSFAVPKTCNNRFRTCKKQVLGCKHSHALRQRWKREKSSQKSYATQMLEWSLDPGLTLYKDSKESNQRRSPEGHAEQCRSGDTSPRTTPHRARHGGGFCVSIRLLAHGRTAT